MKAYIQPIFADDIIALIVAVPAAVRAELPRLVADQVYVLIPSCLRGIHVLAPLPFPEYVPLQAKAIQKQKGAVRAVRRGEADAIPNGSIDKRGQRFRHGIAESVFIRQSGTAYQ